MIGAGPIGVVPLGALPDPALSPVVAHPDLAAFATGRFTIHASTVPFRTGAGDTPAYAAFNGGMKEPISFRWSAGAGSDWAIVSGFGSGEGATTLENTDGRHNILIGPYATDGREHEIRMGAVGVPYRDWFPVFRGSSRGFHVRKLLTVRLTDWGVKLDQPLQASTFLGTGGVEGGADLKGKRKPRLFGFCDNVRPALLDAASRLYMVNDGPVQDIVAFANGLALVDEGDVADAAALAAAVITPGRYKTCLALGLFRINFAIGNTLVTARVEGDNAGSFAGTVPAIVRRMAGSRLTDAEIYEPGFAAYAAGGAYEAGYYADADSRVSVREAIADLLGAGSFAFFTRLGKLSIARLARPSGPPAIRLTDPDIIDVEREELADAIPPREIRVAYGRNWTPMGGNIAGDVDDARRAWLTESLRYAVATSAAIAATHPTSQSRDVVGYLRSEAAAQAVADQLMALRARPAALYRIKTRFKGFHVEQAQVAHVTSQRVKWLSRGRSLFIVDRAVSARGTDTGATVKSSEIVAVGFD